MKWLTYSSQIQLFSVRMNNYLLVLKEVSNHIS